MRAAPAIQVVLKQFSIWQAAIFCLALVAELSLAGWWVGREAQVTAHQTAYQAAYQLAALAVGATSLLLLAWSLARSRSVRLAWDGQGWTLECAALPPGAAPTAGELSVAIDLGPWMLLRFRPTAAARWSAPRCLPVQRRGIEAQWHGLRCAVYSPRVRPCQ